MDDIQPPDDDPSLIPGKQRALRTGWINFLSERVAVWREWRFAKRAALRAMNCRRLLQAARPDISGRDFYESFVCQYGTLESAAARTILRRAEASFAAWPNERELAFRDVVQYLVISEYLRSHPKRGGTTANMSQVISRIVPTGL